METIGALTSVFVVLMVMGFGFHLLYEATWRDDGFWCGVAILGMGLCFGTCAAMVFFGVVIGAAVFGVWVAS